MGTNVPLEYFYKVLAPRPVAIITTIDKEGKVNAAPFSFIMPLSMEPAMLCFATDPEHDTYANIKEVPEFVANLPKEEIAKKLWITGKEFPKGVNELEKAELTQISSKMVRPPSIKECFARIECKVEDTREYGDHALVVGKVVNVDVDSNCYNLDKNLLNVDAAKPLLHLGGSKFALPLKVIDVR